jgi:oxygen-independent coproporphyrinogen-3 oxidase
VPSVLPLGDPAPPDGLLPVQAAAGAEHRAFGLYVHIPFCAVRCGYCDFNTYTATELGGGASQDAYAGTAIAEVAFAGRVLKDSGLPARPLSTVFFGGGTPTLLPAEDLAGILGAAIGRSPPRPTRTPSLPSPCSCWPTPASPGSRSACSPRCPTS